MCTHTYMHACSEGSNPVPYTCKASTSLLSHLLSLLHGKVLNYFYHTRKSYKARLQNQGNIHIIYT